MNIGIVGYGVVGGALSRWLEKFTLHVVLVYDPVKNKLDSLNNCDLCFFCLPAPTLASGKVDTSIIESCFNLISPNTIIYLRSTLQPGTCDQLAKKYNRKIYHCPEFLTERFADEEMDRLPVIVGHEFNPNFQLIFPGKQIYFIKNTEAETIKYVHNCFCAVKVNFFNIIYQFCKRSDVDFNLVSKLANITSFVGELHKQVPGHDGRLGYGGACYPKDMQAFIPLVEKFSTMLTACHYDNNKFRGDNGKN
jgi:UDPglucose 6-dehydrogenase